MPYVNVDVDLDDFDTDELFDEVIKRLKSNGRKKLTTKQREELRNETKNLYTELLLPPMTTIPSESLDDKMKLEVILAYWDKYNSIQLEEKLNH